MFYKTFKPIYWILILAAVEELCNATPDNSTDYRIKRQTVKCPGKFECRNGQCINRFDICDGAENCGDGSDELQATCLKHNIKCPRGTFRCAYGGCVDADKKCNGVKDCADNSDELQLSCPGFTWLTGNFPECRSEKFQCRNGQCIDKYAVCDGTTDCADRTDETVTYCNRESFSCPKNSFQCAYGGCVDEAAKCDFKIDCADGSDEDYILCGRPGPLVPPTVTTPPTIGQVVTLAPKPPTRPPADSCIIQFSAGTSYRLATCVSNCDLKPGDAVSGNYTIVSINCSDSYVNTNENNPYVVCSNGRWIPENHACVRVCRPLVSTSTNIVCRYRGSVVDCEREVRPGTKASVKCKEEYHSEGGIFLDNECMNTGEWLYAIGQQHCSYKCGVLHSEVNIEPLISFGEQANISYHPWNAGLYVQLGEDKLEHICGGTLIAPHSVLTAAHCLYRKNGGMRKKQNIKIGMAKFYRAWNEERDIDAQKLDVENMFISPIYDGHNLHYLHDLAILELTQTVKLTRFVKPACIGTKTYSLRPNMLGTVVGWGENENKVPNPTLQKARLPYHSREECITKTTSKESITKDKFCAFYENGTNVQGGDSGEGITFEFDNRHYVYGVVSTQINHLVSTFTDLTNDEHFKFIQAVLRNITIRRNF